MTARTDAALHDDLLFLRAMAEAGRNVPLTCGPYFLCAGLLFGAASLVAWIVGNHATGLSPWIITWIWLLASLLYVPAAWAIKRHTAAHDGAGATVNQAIARVWTGVSWCIATMFAAETIFAWRLQTPLAWIAFPSMLLALHGAGWAATAMISGQSWLRVVTAGSFAAALLVALTAGSPLTFLIYGVLLLGLLALPGWLLMRRRVRAG